MPRSNPLRWLLLLLVLTLALLVLGLRVGSYETSYSFIACTLHYNPAAPAQLALVELRPPRLLLAWLAGSSLALSGYLLQTLINNPLADPYLLGTASGASLGAIMAYLLVPGLTVAGFYLPPLVVAIGTRRGRVLPAGAAGRGGRGGAGRGRGLAHHLPQGRPG